MIYIIILLAHITINNVIMITIIKNNINPFVENVYCGNDCILSNVVFD